MDHEEVSPELLELARQAVEAELADVDVNAFEGPLIRRRHLVELQGRLATRSGPQVHGEVHGDTEHTRISGHTDENP